MDLGTKTSELALFSYGVGREETWCSKGLTADSLSWIWQTSERVRLLRQLLLERLFLVSFRKGSRVNQKVMPDRAD